MPPGRKTLDAETKAFNRKDTLDRYAEKNRLKLREAARSRAKIQAADLPTIQAHKVKVRQASDKYRDRNREAIRAKDSMRRAKSYIVAQGLEALDTKVASKGMKVTQHKHEGRAPAQHPATLPKKLKLREIAPESSGEDGDEEDSDGDDSEGREPYQARAYFPERIDRRTDAERRADWEAACAAICVHCGEEACCGCGCICPATEIYFEHEGGHWVGKGSSSLHHPLSMAAIPGQVLLCSPCYSPDIGHEDYMAHSADPEGTFFAIDSAHWRGIVTSKQSLERMLKIYPDATYFERPTYLQIMAHWDRECNDYHYHGDASPMSSAPSSPSTLVPTPIPSPPPSPTPMRAKRGPPASETPTRANLRHPPVLRYTKAEHIAKRRQEPPSPAPRAGGSRTALPSPVKIAPSSPMKPTTPLRYHSVTEEELADLFERTGIEGLRRAYQPPHIRAPHSADWREYEHYENRDGPRNGDGTPELMYGVSGHNRIFRDQDRAIEALKCTPGGEMVFFGEDNSELRRFIEEEARRMKKAQKSL
ncbi:hypothetical protein C8R43DRAFT_1116598 [Mycena crocata]|nr:hypothetical protein C8R43DRAFT_1116598 [Mycena crocata]